MHSDQKHQRLIEFYVDNPFHDDLKPMLLLLNVETEISYILSINKSFSLLKLKNGQHFALYGSAKINNSRWIYSLTRDLSNKNLVYFADRTIKPSLHCTYDNQKYELDDVHLDSAIALAISIYHSPTNSLNELYANKEAIEYSFIDDNHLRQAEDKLKLDKKNLGKEVSSVLSLSFSSVN